MIETKDWGNENPKIKINNHTHPLTHTDMHSLTRAHAPILMLCTQAQNTRTHCHAFRHAHSPIHMHTCALTHAHPHPNTHTHTHTKRTWHHIEFESAKSRWIFQVHKCQVPKVHENKTKQKGEIKMEKHAEVHCSTVASLLTDYKRDRRRERKRDRERERERERCPCPEQLQPPGQPAVTQWVLSSVASHLLNPPSLSCSPRGRCGVGKRRWGWGRVQWIIRGLWLP